MQFFGVATLLSITTELSEKLLHYYTRLTALSPGLPGWAGTRKVKLIWEAICIIFSSNNFIDHTYQTIYSLPVYEVNNIQVIKSRLIVMFLAWFHVPVTATEWLWERYGICKTLSTSVTTTNQGQAFFYDIVAWSIRHKIISSNGTTQTTNTTRSEPSCVSRQCRKYTMKLTDITEKH